MNYQNFLSKKSHKISYLLSTLLMTSVISPIVQADSISTKQCDELASSPSSKDKPMGVKGVETKDINSTLAIPACKQAVAEQPNVLRYQYQLARAYYKEKKYDKVLKLVQPLANQGYAPAQASLGFLYRKGIGVIQDYKKAFKWLQKSANQGNASAQTNLGYMYANGKGVIQDYSKAFELFQKSANQGNDNAQANLGYMYETGKGVVQNYKKAVEWYQKSANQGFEGAQASLARLKAKGIY